MEKIISEVKKRERDIKIKFRKLVSPEQSKQKESLYSQLGRSLKELSRQIENLIYRKREIEREKAESDAIISQINGCLVMINPNGKISLINKRGAKFFGHNEPNKIIGKKYSDYLIFRNRKGKIIPAAADPIQQAFSTEKNQIIRLMDGYFYVGSDGFSFPVMISVSPVKTNNKVTSIVAIIYDISKDQKADQVKSEFLSTVSHQLRTPLTVSSLNAEMLLAGEKGALRAGQKKAVEEIYYYNRKMAELLHNFLTVSKIELGTYDLAIRPINIKVLLADVIREFFVLIKEKHIKLVADEVNNLPIIYTDANYLRIILQNIMSNAVKYTPEKGEIAITMIKDREFININIADTGPGINEDEQSLIFNKLYRSEMALMNDPSGTGLGLYIAKSIAAACKMDITCSVKETGGSIFSLCIPIKLSRVVKRKRPKATYLY